MDLGEHKLLSDKQHVCKKWHGCETVCFCFLFFCLFVVVVFVLFLFLSGYFFLDTEAINF